MTTRSESTRARRARRIGASLIAAVFALATWYAAQAFHDAWLTGGNSVLHPSRAVLRSLGRAVFPLLGMTYFSWAAATGHQWLSDGEELD